MGVRSLVEFGDEHRGEIDQTILAFDARKVATMADQLVGDLINDESGFGGGSEGIESVLQEFPFFFWLENAEGNA